MGARKHTTTSLVPSKLAGQWMLRGAPERDDRQVLTSGVVADFEFELDTRLTADESLR